MADRTTQFYVAARGFWLPCDQSSFIHHERHRQLRTPLDLKTFDRSQERETLDDQVLHRLVMVLPDWGYTYAIPVKHVSVPYGNDPDAAVIVHEQFSGTGAHDFAPGVTALRVPAHVRFHGLALLVNSSGFYLWLLRYQVTGGTHEDGAERVQEYLKQYIHTIVGGDVWSRFSGWEDDAQLASPAELEESLEAYQNKHLGILTFIQINTIFEGLFNSALDFGVFFFDTASAQQHTITAAKKEYSLGRFLDLISTHVDETHYRGTKPDGTQADPATHQEPDLSAIPAAGDIAPATGETRGDVQGEVHASQPSAPADDRAIARFLHHLNSAFPHPGHRYPATPDSPGEEADALCHDYLGEHGCSTLLLKFLQATASETLQDYKRRIERCRRALVTEILEVTQRQEGILQVEIPRAARNLGNGGTDRDKNGRIEGVTEAQLRGYVMLFSAKLPLINNIRLYLNEITITNHWYNHRYQPDGRTKRKKAAKAANQIPPPENAAPPVIAPGGATQPAPTSPTPTTDEDTQQVTAAIKMWTTLYRALENDLLGLERAIEHEREDRMVQEEEKIRIEQETIAEIERLQDRNANSLSPQTTLTLGLLSNAFALASVLIAVISIGQHQPMLPHIDVEHYHLGDLLAFLGAVLALGLGLITLYFLAHYAFILVFKVASRLLRVRWDGRYYYEMDIHLETPLDEAKARELLEDHFQPNPFDRQFITDVTTAHRQVKAAESGISFWGRVIHPAFGKPQHNSYRVERQDANAALHKVYVEVVAALGREHWHEFIRPHIALVLVYEIYYHRPAQAPRYILKDLRVVSTQTKTLSASQLAQIKGMVLTSFVNPLLREGTPPLKVGQDSLMSFTGGAFQPPAQPARGWVRGLAVRLRTPAQLLLRVGVAGYALYVGRAILNLAVLTSDNGFGALVNGNALMQAFLVLGERAFIVAYLPLIVVLPIVAAFLLVGIVSVSVRLAHWLWRSILEALAVNDQEAARRRNEARQRQGAQSADANPTPGGASSAQAAPPVAADAQDAAPQIMPPTGTITAGSAITATATATLPWWLRSWRTLVVSAWFTVGMAGQLADGALVMSGVVLTGALGWLGIAIALPVVGEIWRWAMLVAHP